MSSEHLRHERAEPAGDNSINGLSPWAAIVGPCHTADSLSRELGLPRDAVSTAATELRVCVCALQTAPISSLRSKSEAVSFNPICDQCWRSSAVVSTTHGPGPSG